MKYEMLSVKDALKILAVSGIVLSSFTAPNLVIAYNALNKEWRKYRQGDIGKVVKRFYKQKLVKVSEAENGQIVIELSSQGKNKILKYSFDEFGMHPKRRDGKFRMLLFDIPDKHKNARELLRGKLREIGFVRVQESVFITPYTCKDELEFIINYLQIADYCLLVQIGKTELGAQFSFSSKDNFKLEQ